MKADIHPNYRYVVFQDTSSGDKILTRSTIETDETAPQPQADPESAAAEAKAEEPAAEAKAEEPAAEAKAEEPAAEDAGEDKPSA